MPERSWSDSVWIMGGTAMLTAAAVGGVQLWVQGEQHVTGNVSGSGSITVADHVRITGSPACIFVDGKAKHCWIRAALTSTGGTAVPTAPAVFRLQHTAANTGVTGSMAILRFMVAASAPGEAITLSCGTTTGTTLLNSVRTDLLPPIPAGAAHVLGTGGVLQSQTGSGYIILGQNRYVQCTNATAHENAAGLTGEVTMEVMAVN